MTLKLLDELCEKEGILPAAYAYGNAIALIDKGIIPYCLCEGGPEGASVLFDEVSFKPL